MGEKSFIDTKQSYKRKAPPPKYFTDEFLLENFGKLPTDKQKILFGFEYPKTGGLICTDEESLNKQKGVLGHVAKQLAVNLLKGLSISHISLPIKIFEPRSTIHRISDLWTFAPHFLTKAG